MHATKSHAPPLADITIHKSGTQEDAHSPDEARITNGLSNGVKNMPNGVTHDQTSDPSSRMSPPAGRVFIFSSFDEGGIKRTAEVFTKYLSAKVLKDENKYLNDLAYTLSQKRTVFPWKGFVVAASLQELLKRLPEVPRTARHARKSNVPKVGFVFTGQGAQWHAMGRELLVFPVFRRSLEAASAYLDRLKSPWHLMGKFELKLSSM
jgi:acyl transferase domain-containing protein